MADLSERRFFGPASLAEALTLPPVSTEEERGYDISFDALEETIRALGEFDGPEGNGEGVSGARASDLLRAIAQVLPREALVKLGAFDVDAPSELHALSQKLAAVGY